MDSTPRSFSLTDDTLNGPVSQVSGRANAPTPSCPSGEICPTGSGRLVAGRYEIERELGAGGMGVVVAARDTKLGHRVAIKMLHPKGLERPELVARFHREARAAAALQSDHAARVLDSGVDEDGRPYTVMELLEGEDLADAIARRGSFSPAEAASIVMQACDAIGEAHDKGIIHRDIKPANLFLARRPSGSVVVKVLDFGISKSIEPTSTAVTLTNSSTILGSPVYMSPEQLRSAQSVDVRSDVYALTATLYELLVGQPPFFSPAIPELCAMILKDEPRAPGELRAGVSPALDAIVLRGLAKDRSQRFASAHELAEALRPFADERRGLSVAPPSPHVSRPAVVAMVPSDVDTADQLLDEGLGLAHTASEPRSRLVSAMTSAPSDVTADVTAVESVRPPLSSLSGEARSLPPAPPPPPGRRAWPVALAAGMALLGLVGASVSGRGAANLVAREAAPPSAAQVALVGSAPVTHEARVAPEPVVPAVEVVTAAATTSVATAGVVTAASVTSVAAVAPGRADGVAKGAKRVSVIPSREATGSVPAVHREPSPAAPTRRNPLDLQLQ